MVDITVDQKPMPQLPVDPDAKMPESVRRRAAAVDAYYAQQPPAKEAGASPPSSAAPQAAVNPDSAPLPDASSPPASSTEPQLPLEAPASDPTKKPDGPIEPGSWENQYLGMQGRYNAAQKTIGEMQEQMEQLGQELLRTQQLISRPSRPPPPPAYLTPEDEKNFGPEMLDFAQRAARHVLTPELQRLHEENQELRGEINRTTKTALDHALDAAVPNWRQINQNERFHQWLLLPEPYSGVIRDKLLKDAVAAANAPRVIRFFQGFLTEEAATGHLEPSPRPPPVTPPREAAVPLASLAAPGRFRPANGGEPAALPEKPIYQRADIERYSRDYQRGRITEADYQRLSADIVAASREGRIIG